MRAVVAVLALSLLAGCAKKLTHIEIVPVHVIEGAASTSQVGGAERSPVGAVRSVREEGVWLYRLTHEPLTANRVSTLVMIEALFCPGRGDDPSRCRSGVLWRADADPRAAAPGVPAPSPGPTGP
jgi:hypothetical protein